MYLLPKTTALVILTILISFVAGCNQASVPKPTVGLIDMDLVLNKTGRLKVIEGEVMTKRNDIQASLKLIEKGLLSDLQKKQQSFGDKPTPEQEKSLQQDGMKAQQIMQGESQKMEREFNKFLNETREKYITNEINPIIQTICQEKGYYLVILKNQAIVHDKLIDITENVIARIQTLPDAAPVLPGTEPAKMENKSSTPIPSGDIKFEAPKTEPAKEPMIETKPEVTKPAATDAPQAEKSEAKPEPKPAETTPTEAKPIEPKVPAAEEKK